MAVGGKSYAVVVVDRHSRFSRTWRSRWQHVCLVYGEGSDMRGGRGC